MSENISEINSLSIDGGNSSMEESVGNVYSSVDTNKMDLGAAAQACASSGVSSDKIVKLARPYLVDYPLTDSDSENDQNSLPSNVNLSVTAEISSSDSIEEFPASQLPANELVFQERKKQSSETNKSFKQVQNSGKTAGHAKKKIAVHSEIIRSIEGPNGHIIVSDTSSRLEDNLEASAPLSFRYEEDDVASETDGLMSASVDITDNGILTDTSNNRAILVKSTASSISNISFGTDSDISEVASNRSSRFPDSYGLESASDDQGSDSASTHSDDYDLYSYESDDTLNSMLGACDVKDRDLLIEEASTSPATVNASTNENLYRVFGHIVHITSTTVVIRPLLNCPSLYDHTDLFLDEGKTVLGKVSDTFGPIPFYVVQFDSNELLAELGIEKSQAVFYAPNTSLAEYPDAEFSSKTDKENNEESPQECVDFSSDEQERSIRFARGKGRRIAAKKEVVMEGESNNREVHRNFVDRMNKKNAELSAKMAKEDEAKIWPSTSGKQESRFEAIPTGAFASSDSIFNMPPHSSPSSDSIYNLSYPSPSDSIFNLQHSSPSSFHPQPATTTTAMDSFSALNGNGQPSTQRSCYRSGRGKSAQIRSDHYNNPPPPIRQAVSTRMRHHLIPSSVATPPPPPTQSLSNYMVPLPPPPQPQISPSVVNPPPVSASWQQNPLPLPILHYSNPRVSRLNAGMYSREPEIFPPDRRSPYSPYSTPISANAPRFVRCFGGPFQPRFRHSKG